MEGKREGGNSSFETTSEKLSFVSGSCRACAVPSVPVDGDLGRPSLPKTRQPPIPSDARAGFYEFISRRLARVSYAPD